MNYSDVCLVPNYGILDSRSHADVSCEFAGRKWRLPVVPANMKDTISFELAEWMEENNYFYILHRFYSYLEIFEWILNNQHRYISISIGVGTKDKNLLGQIVSQGLRVDCITIDVAHGFAGNVYEMARYIKYIYKGQPMPYIIIGNVSGNDDSIRNLEDWGASSIKVGLAYGKACKTYNQTGFASPMFSAGLEASKYSQVPLIGDGGIRENGDIIKALVAGYDMVMAGSIFAALKDSPPPIITDFIDGNYKEYKGSAAGDKYDEGTVVRLPIQYKTYAEKLLEIEYSLKSAVSYAGGRDLSAFNNVKWIKCND